jgi:hypothetical protein
MASIASKTDVPARTPDWQTNHVGLPFGYRAGKIAADDAGQCRCRKLAVHVSNVAGVDSRSFNSNANLVPAERRVFYIDVLQDFGWRTEAFNLKLRESTRVTLET